MPAAIVTGSGGLIGSEAAAHFAGLGLEVHGIDNDLRRTFFGDEASTAWNIERMERELGEGYVHHAFDIRDREAVDRLFGELGDSIGLVIHAAAQPSHDWAALSPVTDFEVNAVGTLNLLEACRRVAPGAPFVFCSTNKVYGDRPNDLPLVEQATRWELPVDHPFFEGITEEMSIDRTLHSLFGVSKAAADLMVQEYGRYFGMQTVCFRGGTLTGPRHSATRLHGFLAYVMRCAMTGTPYTVFGYGGRQVRDVIHSADLISAFEEFYRAPKSGGQVYNIGGGRQSNCSVLEAITLAEQVTGRPMEWEYDDRARVGDHIWWIGSNTRFEADYPNWGLTRNVEAIAREMFDRNRDIWKPGDSAGND
jgi:CDP-paratose 2-epimerase